MFPAGLDKGGHSYALTVQQQAVHIEYYCPDVLDVGHLHHDNTGKESNLITKTPGITPGASILDAVN